jgi:hypothetical protein
MVEIALPPTVTLEALFEATLPLSPASGAVCPRPSALPANDVVAADRAAWEWLLLDRAECPTDRVLASEAAAVAASGLATSPCSEL